MFYGDGYAGADDVVGHEITHGVIDRSSDLFYWGQSGAINESLADVMGEIVDHRNTLAAGPTPRGPSARTSRAGPIRNMSNPPAMSEPDRMTSPAVDFGHVGNADSGGVHFNSGVGNKTAYLISQGGSFNGQTITGIDVGDPTLSQDRRALLRRDRRGSPPAATTRTSPTSSSRPVRTSSHGGLHGFTAADCTNVREGGARDPAAHHAEQRGAACGCPEGLPDRQSFRLLFDSETGTPVDGVRGRPDVAPRLQPALGQQRGLRARLVVLLRTRRPRPPARSRCRRRSACPPGNRASCGSSSGGCSTTQGATNYDGGTVEVDNTADPAGPVDASGQSWVNGPVDTLHGAQHGSQGLRPRQPRVGRQPARPVRVGRRARAPAVHDAYRRGRSATWAGGWTTSRSTRATAGRS